MNGFDFYSEAWAIYIIAGLILLFLFDLKLRKLGFKWRTGILSFIGICAFTPQLVKNADSYAPLIITSLLNAETDGISEIYSGLITLAITWGIVFAIILAIKHFIDAKKSSISSENTAPTSESELEKELETDN